MAQYIGRETQTGTFSQRLATLQREVAAKNAAAIQRASTQRVSATRISATPTSINTTTSAALKKAKAQYQPGGGFGKGVEAGLERGRVKAMASGMQGLVSAGLAGTTMAGTLGKKYEEEVGAPTRARVEEQRAQALSGIEMQEAGMGFQAGESGAQRSLQMYIAQLQANLQREQMVQRDRPTVSMAAPTGGGYAKQFPSIYGQEAQVPDWTGGGGPAAAPTAGYNTGWIPTEEDIRKATSRQIPAQQTPAAMGSYLKTYTPQTGDYSSVY